MLEIRFFDATSYDPFAQTLTGETVADTVKKIGQAVIAEGDVALRRFTCQFDAPQLDPTTPLRVSEDEKKAAYARVSDPFLTAIQTAKRNILEFHRHQVPQNWQAKAEGGYTYGMRYHAMERVGIYVPGGRALYPSSVLMNALPARLAGVDTIVMVTPPQADGSIAPEVLVAASECDVDIILRIGGAQAIYALAHGTDTVPRVDKIVGPGNAYVDCAKQAVYGRVDIDKPAGPSEVLVYLEDSQYAPYAAAEMLAQCEHDPCAKAITLSTKQDVLEAVAQQLAIQIESLKRTTIIKAALANSALYHVASQEQAIEAINTIASEHLCLLLDDVTPVKKQVRHAGAIFCGPYTPVAAGDYIAGPNHVLPTASAARFSSALAVTDFMTFSSELTTTKDQLAALASPLTTLAAHEQLDGHAESVYIRLN